MKKLLFIMLALSVAVIACESNTNPSRSAKFNPSIARSSAWELTIVTDDLTALNGTRTLVSITPEKIYREEEAYSNDETAYKPFKNWSTNLNKEDFELVAVLAEESKLLKQTSIGLDDLDCAGQNAMTIDFISGDKKENIFDIAPGGFCANHVPDKLSALLNTVDLLVGRYEKIANEEETTNTNSATSTLTTILK